jgi:GNAT superfamily N-acetyltransferase
MSLTVFIPDETTLWRMQAIDIAYTTSRMEVIARNPGNPLGVEFQHHQQSSALMARHMLSEHFNRAVGFSDNTLDEATRALEWYDTNAVAARFDIIPGFATSKLTELLHSKGYRQVGSHTTLVGFADLPGATPADVQTEQVGSADVELFVEAYTSAWQTPAAVVPRMRENIRRWVEVPGWKLYIARYNGQLAGAAILYLHERSAYLADAAVDPQLRGHGVHRALLDRRCEDAYAASAEVVFSQARFLSASYRNMLRKGLSPLYTQALWRRP